MQTSILWKGIEYQSLENCDVNGTDSGTEIRSVVIGTYERKSFKVDYFIKVNSSWQTLFFDLRMQLGNWKQTLVYESDGGGNWYTDGAPVPELKDCIDIDITVSPFTNTLPIKRLNLANNESSTIKVLYLDVLNHSIRSVEQCYTRLSESVYHFATIPRDFEAKIEVDGDGFVVEYPTLFSRSSMRDGVFG